MDTRHVVYHNYRARDMFDDPGAVYIEISRTARGNPAESQIPRSRETMRLFLINTFNDKTDK